MEIPVLYEDNHLIVVEKPVNIPVQANHSGENDLLSMVKQDIKVRYQKPGNVYLGLVHRLDQPVGGVMVFAKTSKAASRLSDVIRRQSLERIYLAVVRGNPPKKKARLEHYLWKNKQRNQVYSVSAQDKKGKKARLDYEWLEQLDDGLHLLSVQLHTGRPHQIRVQLSEVGLPIYGDQKYGSHVNQTGEQIALWAHKLSFKHPTKADKVEVTCSLPARYPWKISSYSS